MKDRWTEKQIKKFAPFIIAMVKQRGNCYTVQKELHGANMPMSCVSCALGDRHRLSKEGEIEKCLQDIACERAKKMMTDHTDIFVAELL